MGTTIEWKLTVYFSNGQRLTYRAELGQDQVDNAGSRLESTLQGNYFGFRVEGKLVIIPFSGVQRVEIEPAPEALIGHVLPCVRQIEEKLTPDAP